MAQEYKHKRFTIKVEQTASGWRGRWLGKTPPHGPIMSGKSESEIIDSIKEDLDFRHAQQVKKRGESGFPHSDEVLDALRGMEISHAQMLMLKAHYNAPDNVLTAEQIANAAGYSSYSTANSMYGKLGRQLAEELDWNPKELNTEGRPIWTFALATCSDDQVLNGLDEGDHFEWQMRPEVVDALEEFLV